MAGLGLAAYMLLSVAPVFSAVAPPMRSKPRIAATASANDALAAADRIAALEQKMADAQSAGDNAWMLVSSGLVLLMTGPGLALFYGGLVRKKNVLGTMMQRFSSMAWISVLWALFGYSLCFAPGNPFIGGLDYVLLHNVAGVSALICALYLGKRIGYPREPLLPHSVVLSFIGACLLWVGWFGFNAGSALSAGRLASSAFIATHFAAAAAALAWAGVEWLRNGKPSALGAISGAVAGLVAITPASGFVGPISALAIGFCAGAICYFMVAVLKPRLGYDDSLDAFGVHGAGGTLGALFTGVFALAVVNPVFHDSQGNALPLGLLDGHGRQILNQLAGVAISWGLAIVGTLVILKVTDLLVGVRVSGEHELQGLDLSQHGEVGYDFES